MSQREYQKRRACQNYGQTTGPQTNRRGHWTVDEEMSYYIFLYHHLEKFFADDVRRSLRMFKSMSLFIKTRTASQCRTHHQKVCQKYGGLQQNIQQYLEKTPRFGAAYERVTPILDCLEDKIFYGSLDKLHELAPHSGASSNIPQLKVEELKFLEPLDEQREKGGQKARRYEVKIEEEDKSNNLKGGQCEKWGSGGLLLKMPGIAMLYF